MTVQSICSEQRDSHTLKGSSTFSCDDARMKFHKLMNNSRNEMKLLTQLQQDSQAEFTVYLLQVDRSGKLSPIVEHLMCVLGELKILLEHTETSKLQAARGSQTMSAEVQPIDCPCLTWMFAQPMSAVDNPALTASSQSNDHNDNETHMSDLSASIPNQIENLWRLSDQSLLRSSLPETGLACSQAYLHYDVVTKPLDSTHLSCVYPDNLDVWSVIAKLCCCPLQLLCNILVFIQTLIYISLLTSNSISVFYKTENLNFVVFL